MVVLLPPKRRSRGRARRLRFTRLALVASILFSGCGREFFREWADQDVTEAIFEKSRDPRWRLPLFTIDPPAMSRFADYSDTDRPPAPPDDPAAEALSPVPQKPHYRMMVPMEGTGYLDMLETGPRYEPLPQDLQQQRRDPGTAVPTMRDIAPVPVGPAPFTPAPEGTTPPTTPPPPEPGDLPPADPSLPSLPQNLGTDSGEMTPNTTVPAAPPADPPADRSDPPAIPPQANSQKRDPNVLVAAFQAPETLPATPGSEIIPGAGNTPLPAGVQEQPQPQPVVPGGEVSPDQAAPPPRQLERDPTEPGGALGTEGPGRVQVDVNAPPITRPGATPEQVREIRAATSGFAALLSSVPIDFSEALTAGLPALSRPYVIGPAQALQLALINSRAYQFQLESMYLQSLTVTLNRFAFQPQFYAGQNPLTGVATGPTGTGGSFPAGGTGINQFVYRTEEAPGGQASTLTLSEAAGFGKLLVFGGRVLGGFASTTVFNFVGQNPSQPAVQSTLPLSFIQPFLRGGGRAVTLEPLTLAERNLLYEVRSFARFRQQFFVSILTAQQGVTAPGAQADPNVGYLNLLQNFLIAENTRINVASFERALEIYKEYEAGGASSGISQLQVDQIDQNLQQARGALINQQVQYRNFLDQYKMQLGLPPDTPLIPDVSLIQGFREVSRDILEWQAREDHDPNELPGIVSQIPALQNVILDDRPLFDYSGDEPRPVFADTEKVEEFNLVAERIALESRLDLMNQRATLYDQWRQLAVQANSLLPFFNVNINYQQITPGTTSNPFGFDSQSSQFNLSFNTELPLVRVNERNNFRTSLINYQRARRQLMFLEDQIKFQVRQDIRGLIQSAENYEISKANLVLVLRQRDQALQQIIAPPEQVGAGFNPNLAANQATQTINFITSVNTVLQQQNNLIQLWVSYQTQRLALYRDLGIMPYDEWEAYYALFPAEATGTRPGASQPGAAAGAPDAVPAAEPGA
jgi:hypothetical protein